MTTSVIHLDLLILYICYKICVCVLSFPRIIDIGLNLSRGACTLEYRILYFVYSILRRYIHR